MIITMIILLFNSSNVFKKTRADSSQFNPGHQGILETNQKTHKSHTLNMPFAPKKKTRFVSVLPYTHTHKDTQIMFLVKTFQLNLSQTNSVGAELLVVDENCAANRLTL